MRGFTQIPNDDVFEHPLWGNDVYTKREALIELYYLAQFKERDLEVRGRIIKAKVGQVVRSLEYLKKRCCERSVLR